MLLRDNCWVISKVNIVLENIVEGCWLVKISVYIVLVNIVSMMNWVIFILF